MTQQQQNRAERRKQMRREGFDANQASRLQFTIGEGTYHRVVTNNDVTREMHRLLRLQDLQIGRLDEQVDEPPADTPIEHFDEIEAERERLIEEQDKHAYNLLALLLVDDEGNPPPVALLQNKLDMEVVVEMTRALLRRTLAELTPEETRALVAAGGRLFEGEATR